MRVLDPRLPRAHLRLHHRTVRRFTTNHNFRRHLDYFLDLHVGNFGTAARHLHTLHLVHHDLDHRTSHHIRLLGQRLRQLLRPHAIARCRRAFTNLAPNLACHHRHLAHTLLRHSSIHLGITHQTLHLTHRHTRFIHRRHGATANFAHTHHFSNYIRHRRINLFNSAISRHRRRFGLLALLHRPLSSFHPNVSLPNRHFSRTTSLNQHSNIFIDNLTGVRRLLRNNLRHITFQLHLVNRLQRHTRTLNRFITLRTHHHVNTNVTRDRHTSFGTNTLNCVTHFARSQLRFISRTVSHQNRITSFVLTISLCTFNRITLTHHRVVRYNGRRFRTVSRAATRRRHRRRRRTRAGRHRTRTSTPTRHTNHFLRNTNNINFRLNNNILHQLRAHTRHHNTFDNHAFRAITSRLVTTNSRYRRTLIRVHRVNFRQHHQGTRRSLTSFRTIQISQNFRMMSQEVIFHHVRRFIRHALTLAFLGRHLISQIFPIRMTHRILTNNIIMGRRRRIKVTLNTTNGFKRNQRITIPRHAQYSQNRRLHRIVNQVLRIFFRHHPRLQLLILRTHQRAHHRTLANINQRTIRTQHSFAPNLLRFAKRLLAINTRTRARVNFRYDRHTPDRNSNGRRLRRGDSAGDGRR